MNRFDIIVIGAGIAGTSIAAHLAARKRVCILEMEERAGYHTTGRSAASYEPNYGPKPILALTRASAGFFHTPPQGFADAPLLQARDSLFLEADGQQEQTRALLAASVGLEEVSEDGAIAALPILRRGYARRAFLDRHTADMDVDLIHRGYLRMFKENGGTIAYNAPSRAIERRDGVWIVHGKAGDFEAPVIVNAAGAWGDAVAAQAGVRPVGLVAKRRSIGIVPGPQQTDFAAWPIVTDVGETWYAKPQSGKFIVSSADATPVEPHDAYADDMAIAEGIERLMTATTLEVERLEHSWGGLRTFAPDGNPVVGFDLYTEGFFWLVGQGGYGIQSCPALAETAAALVLVEPVPQSVIQHGLAVADIAPERFARS